MFVIVVTTATLAVALRKGWLKHRGRILRWRSPQRYRRAPAQVIDVQMVDEADRNNRHTLYYRVLLKFAPMDGELVVVDKQFEPTQAQKDMMLPDQWLMIDYDTTNPEDFEILFSAGAVGPDGAPVTRRS